MKDLVERAVALVKLQRWEMVDRNTIPSGLSLNTDSIWWSQDPWLDLEKVKGRWKPGRPGNWEVYLQGY